MVLFIINLDSYCHDADVQSVSVLHRAALLGSGDDAEDYL